MSDGNRSLKPSRKTRTLNPGPMPNRLGRMQSTIAEPRGRGTYRHIGDTFPSAATFVPENVKFWSCPDGFRERELGFEVRKIGVPGIFFLNNGRIDCVAAIK